MHEERCGCLDIIIKAPQGGLGGEGMEYLKEQISSRQFWKLKDYL